MTFETYDTVFFTITFLVPGFIWSAVLSMLVPRRRRSIELKTLEFLTLSCFNYGLWSWALYSIFRTGFFQGHPAWACIVLFVIGFISPVGLGLLTGKLQQKERIARLLVRFGFQPINPIPSAWDYHFSRQQPYWVTVILKDGSRIRGFFGLKSFAGDAPEHRDLYIEAVYRLTDTGDWAPVEDSGGVLILSDQIALVEFRNIPEVHYERNG